ncbi:FkbM family methyltransferase [Patescibacteria group bacterium]|nr:FkbM family methyltransferase [Patescibacteria group bacterium]
MTTLYEASKLFLQEPKSSYKKIAPFLLSKLLRIRRNCAEMIGLDWYSKPYPGHQKLTTYLNYQNGTYVVCGANDGYMVDPTYYLDKFQGWKGVLIEPLPKALRELNRNRPNNIVFGVACVPENYKDTSITIYDVNAMSLTHLSKLNVDNWVQQGEKAQNIIAKKIDVQARSLSSLLQEAQLKNDFDLLVIDIEGAEESILRDFDFTVYHPTFLLIEIENENAKAEIDTILSPFYRYCEMVGDSDYLYKRS